MSEGAVDVLELSRVLVFWEVGRHRHKNMPKAIMRPLDLYVAPPSKVPVSATVKREGEPSDNYVVTVNRTYDGKPVAVFAPNLPNPQWFLREVVYIEMLAQGYEYSEPRLGMSRWPTLSETANALLFNLTEGSENQVSTVDATIEIATTVDTRETPRTVAIIERMDDGQWRVAGYGEDTNVGLTTVPLKITTSGTLFAVGFDDFGITFVGGLPVSEGTRIRPTQYRGWLYQATEAGVLPNTEPEWWPALGDNVSRLVGTARLQAVRYYQPIAHGPVPAILV